MRPPESGPPTPPTGKGRVPAWVRVAVSLGVLGVLVALLPGGELVAAFGRVSPFVWIVSVPIYLALHFIGVAKWRMLMGAAGARFRVSEAAHCYYAGLFGSILLPSVVGGDLVRAGLAMRLSRARVAVLFGSVLDRMIDVVALASVAGFGILAVPGALDPQSRRIFVALLVGAAGLGIVGAACLLLLPARRFPFRIRRHLVRVRAAARTFRRSPRFVLTALAAAIALQSSLVVLNAWLGRACGLEAALSTWFFVWPLGKLAALVPVTQAGIGVREAALVGLFAPFGVPAVLAVAAGLAFQGVVFAGGFAGGLLSYLLGRTAAVGQTSRL